MQFLSEGNSDIVPHLLSSIGGVPAYRDHNVLDGLVRRSLALVIARDLQGNADRYGAPQFGSHLERYLVDAMRRLAISSPHWAPNGERSRAWLGSEGLFLLWPQAAADMQAMLEADQLAGIPKAPETVFELLLAAGVFERQPDGSANWFILPPASRTALPAVKLTSPAILLAGRDTQPQPLSDRLVCAPDAIRPAPSSPPGRDASPTGTQFSLLDAPEPTALVAPAAAPAHIPNRSPRPCLADAPEASTAAPLHSPPPARPLPPAPPALKLNTPMRLDPAVRGALSAIVDTLNGPGTAAAAAVAAGLFVPLHELERRGIQPALAARALADLGLLVHTDRGRPATVRRDFCGEPTVGIILVPRCVDGFDPESLLPATQAES